MRKASDTGRPHLSEAEREKLRDRARRSRELLTPQEDAAITAAALADPDAQPSDDLFRRKLGRPKAENPKQQIALRVDRDVLDRFKEGGRGWQSRMNEALRKSVGL